MSTRRKLVPIAVIAVTVLVVSVITGCSSGNGEQAQQIQTTAPAVVPASPPLSATTSLGASASPSSSPDSPQAAPSKTLIPNLQIVRPPAKQGKFSIQIGNPKPNKLQCPMPLSVLPMPAQENTPVQPPESSKYNWCGTSRWLEGWAFPSYPSSGKTWIAIHACQHHQCGASFIKCKTHCTTNDQTPSRTFSLKVGQPIVITTGTGVLTYRICSINASSKSRTRVRVVDGSCSSIELEVVLCEIESGNTSANNIVLSAHLVKSRTR